ncbi:hypothetical protein KTC96_08495 [Clostridium estertheticum]|uniref:hypothetical protein n=1 Tax=Clostridium estertheticum TaxID=238834 RepID=UPI001C7DF5F4|nr:hypothetical protein [Clostridium estertheticum]MBX4259987.1 hypothetical protein [Clostridium estertheticum]WLC72008.1 hypothetical protein KTC96_08495 [Clostridium estertheticum]
MKPNLFRISMLPTISLQENTNLEQLLGLLDKNEKLIPNKWGNNERIKVDYKRNEILEKVLTKDIRFNEVFVYSNEKPIKYEGWFLTEKSYRAYLEFEFSKNMAPKYWKDFFYLSDNIANIVKPRFGVITMWSDEIKIDSYDSKALFYNMLESRSCSPGEFLPDGPLGVGLRTYFNEEIINLFGRKFLLNAPAYVEELEWGGIRIDLVKDPWNSEMECMFEAWIKVMDYLKKAEVFSHYIFRGEDVMAKIVTSEKWKDFVNSL